MGNICSELQNVDDAIQYYEHALSICKAVLGEQHSSVADIYHSMGSLLQEHGNLDGAIAYHNEAWQIYENLVGKEAISVADQYKMLATSLQNRGRIDEAMMFFERFFDIKAKFQREDVALAETLIGVGNILWEQSRAHEAMSRFQQAIHIYENMKNEVGRSIQYEVGRSVADAYHEMAKKLDKLGEGDQCIECYRKAYVAYKKAKMYSMATVVHNDMADKIIHKQKRLVLILEELQAEQVS